MPISIVEPVQSCTEPLEATKIYDRLAAAGVIRMQGRAMASIYLSKWCPQTGCRNFHLADKSLTEVINAFGLRREDHEPQVPSRREPSLSVLVSIEEQEGRGTAFQAGLYRAAVKPHHVLRQCGKGLSDILGTPQDDPH